MSVEVTRLRESSITDLALVRFFSSVCSVMLGQSGAVGKTLSTHVAFVRSVSGVCPHVRRHRRALGKPATANWTLEWFFSGVSAKVCGKVSSLGERFLAD